MNDRNCRFIVKIWDPEPIGKRAVAGEGAANVNASSHDRFASRFHDPFGRGRVIAVSPCAVGILVGLITVMCSQSGCRGIVKFGESRQTVAARRLSRQGLKAAREGDWMIAETLFSESLDVSDSNDAAHRGLADTLWQRGRRNDAIEHLKQAVQLSAGDPKHLQRLGRMYLELGRVDEAARQCEIALQSDREWAALWALWGDCENAQGRADSALAAYHRALSLQPDYPYVQLQAAEIYHRQQRHDRLLATLDRLNESSSSLMMNQTDGGIVPGRADLLRGLAMRELGRIEESNRYLVAAAQKNPTDVTARLQLAAASIAGGDPVSAQGWLAQAMQVDPEAVAASGWVRSGIDTSELANNMIPSAMEDPTTAGRASAYGSASAYQLPADFEVPTSRSRMAVGPVESENR
ncbi:tetratricopeptide repeat protein [Rhodopirellula sp. SWK7]|uniref:tetratricopeptide repeat protein n=1 Tax=Rhodopirellula sp. SWK7 TaxID=595460 RepID=UPI0002BDC69F|nr:tetratricopeptide repeat protein [Rhodopirellula sp. SWK7]EMI41242.1 TPR repeat-containing protein [Rhodopirellula sp. SWK7]